MSLIDLVPVALALFTLGVPLAILAREVWSCWRIHREFPKDV